MYVRQGRDHRHRAVGKRSDSVCDCLCAIVSKTHSSSRAQVERVDVVVEEEAVVADKAVNVRSSVDLHSEVIKR